VDQRGPIVTGPREAVEAEVRSAIREAGRAGFIVGAGCPVPNDIEVAHLAWAIEAAHAV
jgi:uroporphyrinogen-III decarboxylase